MKKKTVQIGDTVYEEAHPQAATASKVVVDMWIRLGRPTNPFTKSGEKLMNIIIAIWEDCYPKDAREWYAVRQQYQDAELTISEQVSKKTGRSLASYPYAVFAMMNAVFAGFDPTERKNCIKMVAQWPQFRFANKV